MDENTTPTPGETPDPHTAAPAAPQASPPPSAPSAPDAPAAPATVPYPRPTGGGMVSQEDKSQATLLWVLTIFFWFVPALIFFLTQKDKPFVYRQAALALTLEIVVAVIYAAGAVLTVILIGFLLFPVAGIFHLVIGIMGAIAVNKGEDFNPPIITGLTKSLFKI